MTTPPQLMGDDGMNYPAPTTDGSALFVWNGRDPDHSPPGRSAGPRHSRAVTAGRHYRVRSDERLTDGLTDKPDVAVRVYGPARQSNPTRAGSSFVPHHDQFIA